MGTSSGDIKAEPAASGSQVPHNSISTGERIATRLRQGLQAVHETTASLGNEVVDVLIRILDLSEGVTSLYSEIELLRERMEGIADAIVEILTHSSSLSAGNVNLKLSNLKKVLDQIEDFLRRKLPTGLTWIAMSREQLLQMKVFNARLSNALEAFQFNAALSVQYAMHSQTIGVSDIVVQPAFPISIPDSELLPPSPPYLFGRDAEVTTLSDALVSDKSVHICLRGPPGIGKSALALYLINDDQVANAFGPSRFFVRLGKAETSEDVWLSIARCMGVAGRDLKRQVLLGLRAAGRAALVLDGLEKSWESTQRWQVEEVLRHLSHLPNLFLVATLRGQEYPHGVDWHHSVSYILQPIDLVASRDLLHAISGQLGPEWVPLLQELDGIPLAVELTAHAIAGGLEKDALKKLLSAGHIAVLDRLGPQQNADSSITLSIQLSVESPRLMNHPDAKRLLGVLALLPDGISAHLLVDILTNALPNVRTMLGVLCQTSLAHEVEEQNRRLVKCLGPVRAFISSSVGCERELYLPLIEYYLGEVAGAAGDIFRTGNSGYQLVSPELGNLEAILSLAWDLQDIPLEDILHGVLGLGIFTAFTNLGSTHTLELAVARARDFRHEHASYREEILLFAKCASILAEVYLLRGHYQKAEECFNIARDLFTSSSRYPHDHVDAPTRDYTLHNFKTSRTLGFGNTPVENQEHHHLLDPRHIDSRVVVPAHRTIPGMHFRDSSQKNRIQRAKKSLHEAEIGTGLANCLRGQGDVQFFFENHEASLDYYRKAEQLFSAAGDVLGVANCLKGRGIVHLQRSTIAGFDAEREIYDASRCFYDGRACFEQVEDSLGQAYCLKGLADVKCRQHSWSFEEYQAALDFFVAAGAYSGEADCLLSMGDMQKAMQQYDGAMNYYAKALAIYKEAYDILGQATCMTRLADALRRLVQPRADLAATYYAQAAAAFAENNMSLQQGRCCSELAEIYLADGKPDLAFQESNKACVLIRFDDKHVDLVISSRLVLSRILALRNNPTKAVVILSEVLDKAVECGRLQAQKEIRSLLGEISAQLPRSESKQPSSVATNRSTPYSLSQPDRLQGRQPTSERFVQLHLSSSVVSGSIPSSLSSAHSRSNSPSNLGAQAAAVWGKDDKLCKGRRCLELAKSYLVNRTLEAAFNECTKACELIPMNTTGDVELVISSRILLGQILIAMRNFGTARIPLEEALEKAVETGQLKRQQYIGSLLTDIGTPQLEVGDVISELLSSFPVASSSTTPSPSASQRSKFKGLGLLKGIFSKFRYPTEQEAAKQSQVALR